MAVHVTLFYFPCMSLLFNLLSYVIYTFIYYNVLSVILRLLCAVNKHTIQYNTSKAGQSQWLVTFNSRPEIQTFRVAESSSNDCFILVLYCSLIECKDYIQIVGHHGTKVIPSSLRV